MDRIWYDVTSKKKRRKSPRALRFADIKVGDQLMQKPRGDWCRKIPLYFLVTDIWFDPVAGQRDPVAGQMVAIVPIRTDGETLKGKTGYPIRGLASQQYHYADVDYIARGKAIASAHAAGKVVGIGRALVLRRRPKIPGG